MLLSKQCFIFETVNNIIFPRIEQCERDKNCIAIWKKTREGGTVKNIDIYIYIYRSRNKINAKKKRGMENEEEQKVKRDGKTGVLVTRIKKNGKKKIIKNWGKYRCFYRYNVVSPFVPLSVSFHPSSRWLTLPRRGAELTKRICMETFSLLVWEVRIVKLPLKEK